VLLITGPSGNVGAELVETLRATLPPDGWRVASRDPEQLARRLGGDAQVAAFDFFDRTTWPAALDGVQRLFLLFPLPGNRAAREAVIPFIEAAQWAGCRAPGLRLGVRRRPSAVHPALQGRGRTAAERHEHHDAAVQASSCRTCTG